MAIQARRGLDAEFDPYKMLPGEFAVSLDGKWIYMCFSPGVVKKMATNEDFAEMLTAAQEATARAEAAAAVAEGLVVNKAGINDLTATTTEAYSGVKTESLVTGAITESKSYADGLFGGITSFKIAIVAVLPTENISSSTIYFIPKESEVENNYDEWMYINSAWEHIGSISMDLSGYVLQADFDSRMNNVYIDAKKFGALGDGTTSDSVAIQNAINYASANNKNVLIPKSGQPYIITTTIKIPSDIKLRIDGTLKLANASNVNIFENLDTVNGNTDITIQGGIIDDNKANQSAISLPLNFVKVTNLVLDEVEVTGSWSNTSKGSINLEYCTNFLVKNCILHDAYEEGLFAQYCDGGEVQGGFYYNNPNGSGIATKGGTGIIVIGAMSYDNAGGNFSINSANSKVIGCISDGSTVNGGIGVGHPGLPADDAVISGCTIINNALNGIIVQSSKDVILTNNIIKNNGDYGVKVDGNASNAIIANNLLEQNTGGVSIYAPTYSHTVSGNRILNSLKHGMDINGANNIIEGNTVKNSGYGGTYTSQYGIYLEQAITQGNIVTGNICTDDQATKTQERGIYCTGTNNLIANNICKGNKTLELVASTDNRLSGNVLSDSDTSFEVTLTVNTTTSVSNANIKHNTPIAIFPTTTGAASRNVFVSTQTDGTLTFTHTAVASSADKVKVNLI